MNTVKLNFINRSNDQNNSSVVIFQKNTAGDFDEIAVAWKIMENCAQGWEHTFDFELNPTIWIGVASQTQADDIINSAILSDKNTEISLLGIKSADIVMRGGGPGETATPFVFVLENVVYA